MFQIKAWGLVTIIYVGLAFGSADAALKGTIVGKTKSGGRRGFYGSRFGSVYSASDFQPEVSTTVIPELLRVGQVPTGVAGSHQQNINEIKAEYPNVEESTIVSDDYSLGVKGGVKGGVNGGVKGGVNGGVKGGVNGGVKGGVNGGVKGGVNGGRPFGSLTTPPSLVPDDLIAYTSFAPIELPTEGPIRVTIEPNGIAVTPVSDNLTKKSSKGGRKGFQYDVQKIKELFSDNLVTDSPTDIPTAGPTEVPIRVTVEPVTAVSENLLKSAKKGAKGGRKGFQYDVQKIKELFSDNLVTDAPAEATTIGGFMPQILNLPTERQRGDGLVLATEDYREDTVQQTQIPIQPTEIPVEQTEIPAQQTEQSVQQTELPVQQTELPEQQTELSVQQTEEPYRETEPVTQKIIPTTFIPTTTDLYEPSQDTQSPIEPQVTQIPELPVQTTYQPTTTDFPNDQQTEIPQVTQLPEEPVYTTQAPTTVAPDEFQRYPLGLEGSHQMSGAGAGKGKGSKGSKGFKSSKRPRVNVVNRGTAGVNSRRPRLGEDPATPLLPSLMTPVY